VGVRVEGEKARASGLRANLHHGGEMVEDVNCRANDNGGLGLVVNVVLDLNAV
jgi:hypothetical protein